MKATKVCIFCGNAKLSKEHFWPDWCNSLFPIGALDSRIEISFARRGPLDLLVSPATIRNRPGRVITKKLRVVCPACNNTWMSKIESDAKPILLSCFKGKPITLGKSEKPILAKWITLKVMISEYSKPGDSITPLNERLAFRETRKIPGWFQIWLGACNAQKWQSAHFRQAATYTLPHQKPDKLSDKNTQTVTIGFGQLLIFVYAQRHEPLLCDLLPNSRFLRKLHPFDMDEMTWPPDRFHTSEEADSLSYSLDEMQRTGPVRWKPWPEQ
jgi:hypothetical protein